MCNWFTMGPVGGTAAFIATFLERVRDRLGAEFIGLYAYGSLAGGDFDPASSDLDLLVAIRNDLTNERLETLRELHSAISRGPDPWANRMEAWYIPTAVLRRHDPALRNRSACISTVNLFGEMEPDEAWILNRWTVREKSAAFAGPDPKTLIDPIEPDSIKAAVRNMLRYEWSRSLSEHEWMRPRKYQAFTVLTMCRALIALEHGELISKPAAADWALRTLDPAWHPLIRQALERRADPAPDDVMPALDFVKFAIARATASPG